MNLHQMVLLRASVKTFENLRNSRKRSEKVKKTAVLKLLTLCPVFQLVEFSNFLNKKGIVGLNFTIAIFFSFYYSVLGLILYVHIARETYAYLSFILDKRV